VDGHMLRTRACIIAALLLLLTLPGCSKHQTSPAALCDNEGADLIAFSSDRGPPGQYDIYLYDADLAGFRLLKNLNSASASDSSPAISRDGQLIAFVSDRGSTGTTDLLIYERISCSMLATGGINTPGNETEPAFTGDTRRLAFVRDTLGHRRIRLVNGGSLDFENLPGLDTPGAAYEDWSPAADSTGDRIVFLSDREGAPHIYLYDRSTQKVDSLNDLRAGSARDLDPTLTPDARYLCFASDRVGSLGGLDIFLVDFTNRGLGVQAPPNLNTAGDERHPRIGHSGAFIAFQSQSPDSTGWNVCYYSRAGGLVVKPSPLAGIGTDIHPTVCLP
jgi:Tol biopolymer transport system component